MLSDKEKDGEFDKNKRGYICDWEYILTATCCTFEGNKYKELHYVNLRASTICKWIKLKIKCKHELSNRLEEVTSLPRQPA